MICCMPMFPFNYVQTSSSLWKPGINCRYHPIPGLAQSVCHLIKSDVLVMNVIKPCTGWGHQGDFWNLTCIFLTSSQDINIFFFILVTFPCINACLSFVSNYTYWRYKQTHSYCLITVINVFKLFSCLRLLHRTLKQMYCSLSISV